MYEKNMENGKIGNLFDLPLIEILLYEQFFM
jgi:hypothetical protein